MYSYVFTYRVPVLAESIYPVAYSHRRRVKNTFLSYAGAGELAEVWFDGGYPAGTEELIPELLQRLQPNAVAFQGQNEAGVFVWEYSLVSSLKEEDLPH